MTTLDEATDSLAAACTPVPLAGPGVCIVCRNWPSPGYSRCYSCNKVLAQVTRPCQQVVPVSLVKTGRNQLYYELWKYKDPGAARQLRLRFRRDLVGLLGRFVRDHGACIAEASGGTWDGVVAVPSSKGRRGPHPLTKGLSLYPPLGDIRRDALAPGTVEINWNHADDKGFTVTEDVRGERLLIVDDTFTTGARAQSAASALALAGAQVVAVVPIARVISLNPDYPHVIDAWKRQRAAGFDFDACCLE